MNALAHLLKLPAGDPIDRHRVTERRSRVFRITPGVVSVRGECLFAAAKLRVFAPDSRITLTVAGLEGRDHERRSVIAHLARGWRRVREVAGDLRFVLDGEGAGTLSHRAPPLAVTSRTRDHSSSLLFLFLFLQATIDADRQYILDSVARDVGLARVGREIRNALVASVRWDTRVFLACTHVPRWRARLTHAPCAQGNGAHV
jgi:hypothetical protein